MNLFLDDVRYPKQVTWINLPLVKWVIIRSYKEFKTIIIKNGIPEIISFDHDLGLQMESEEKTGYHCASFIIEYCMNHGLELPEYYIHSHNPVGAANIKSLLESYKKSLDID
jgi:hypothetical protein